MRVQKVALDYKIAAWKVFQTDLPRRDRAVVVSCGAFGSAVALTENEKFQRG